jgi:hypothetical protein
MIVATAMVAHGQRFEHRFGAHNRSTHRCRVSSSRRASSRYQSTRFGLRRMFRTRRLRWERSADVLCLRGNLARAPSESTIARYCDCKRVENAKEGSRPHALNARASPAFVTRYQQGACIRRSKCLDLAAVVCEWFEVPNNLSNSGVCAKRPRSDRHIAARGFG